MIFQTRSDVEQSNYTSNLEKSTFYFSNPKSIMGAIRRKYLRRNPGAHACRMSRARNGGACGNAAKSELILCCRALGKGKKDEEENADPLVSVVFEEIPVPHDFRTVSGRSHKSPAADQPENFGNDRRQRHQWRGVRPAAAAVGTVSGRYGSPFGAAVHIFDVF